MFQARVHFGRKSKDPEPQPVRPRFLSRGESQRDNARMNRQHVCSVHSASLGTEKHESDVTNDNFKGTSSDLSS